MAPVNSALSSITDRLLTIYQRPNTLPEPITDSARQAREAFYCKHTNPPASMAPCVIDVYKSTLYVLTVDLSSGDLCKKGYARVTDYNTHLMSYDHSHHAVSVSSPKSIVCNLD